MSAEVLDAVLAEYGTHAVDRALCLIREDWDSRQVAVPIPLSAALAEGWHAFKLANCRLLADQGGTPPPVSAVGLRIMGRVLYSLTDGNHRVIVGRERGRTHLLAKVAGYYTCDPTRFFMADGHLWKMLPDGRAEVVWEVGDEAEPILVKLGVRRHGKASE